MEQTREYAKANGLDLDESLAPDLGVSAFRGKNRIKGSLGSFLNDCKTGKVPAGSALIVESLDRISRQDVEEALHRFLDLVRDYGIEIHTTSDRQVYRKGKLDVQQLMLSIFVMSRSNEESLRKSDRISATWEVKKATNGSALNRLPPWLKSVNGRAELDEPKAAIARRIFELAANGMGQKAIAKKMIVDGVAPIAKGWAPSTVQRILHSESAIGTYQPNKKDRETERFVADGEPKLNFFPSLISDELWLKVKTTMADRRSRPTTGRGVKAHNLFGGIAWDVTQGQRWAMHFVDRSGQRLYTHWKAPVHNMIRYRPFEAAFLQMLDQINWKGLMGAQDNAELATAEATVASRTLEIARADAQIANVVDLLVELPSSALKAKLAALEASKATLVSELAKAKEIVASIERQSHDFLGERIAYRELANSRDPELRTKLRSEIQKRVRSVEFLQFKPTVLAQVTFTNGVVRQIETEEIYPGVFTNTFHGLIGDTIPLLEQLTADDFALTPPDAVRREEEGAKLVPLFMTAWHPPGWRPPGL